MKLLKIPWGGGSEKAEGESENIDGLSAEEPGLPSGDISDEMIRDGAIFTGEFKPGIITQVVSEVTQEGKTISASDKINPKKPFRIVMKPTVPFDINGGPGKLGPGDSTTLKISENVSIPETKVFEIKAKSSNKIGVTITFKNEGNAVVAEFKIAEDRSVFAGSDGFELIELGLEYTIKQNGTQQATPLTEIYVLDKKYDVLDVSPAVSIKKTGEIDYNTHSILWKADITSKNSLAGYTFFDDLNPISDEGISSALRSGSFEIKDEHNSDILGGNYHYNDNKISYTFPGGAPNKAVITFRTEISWHKFKNGFDKKKNTALIKQGDKEIDKSSAEVYLIADWGSKNVSGGDNDKRGNDYYITWTIDFNGSYKDKDGRVKGRKLEDVRIKDILPSDGSGTAKLEWVSATLEAISEAGQAIADKTKIYNTEPADKFYKLSDIGIAELNGKVRLTIVSKIACSKAVYRKEFTNTAEIYWNGEYGDNAAKVTLEKDIVLAAGNPELKKETANGYKKDGNDSAPADVTWEISVKNGVLTENTYFYDVFLSGVALNNNNEDVIDWGFFNSNNRESDRDKLSVKGPNGETALASGIDVKKVLPRSDVRNVYMGNFNDKSGLSLTHKVYNLLYDGKAIGKVLEVTGFRKDVSKNDNHEYKFTFDSKLVDPRHLTATKLREEKKQDQNTNRAYLVEKTGSNYKIHPPAHDWPYYDSNMLKKGVIPTTNAENIMKGSYTLNDINQDPQEEYYDKNNTAVKEAFSAKERSILYRLSVNADGLNNFKEYLEMRLEDEFPNGWEVTDINSSNKYLVYEGKKLEPLERIGKKGYVEAIGSPLTNAQIQSLFDAKMEGKKLTFNLSNINKPYVIILRLKINDDLNAKGIIKNIAKLSLKLKGSNDKSTKTVESHVSAVYDARFLSKDNLSSDIETNNQIKSIKWKIELNPDFMPTSIKSKLDNANTIELVDTLGQGIEVLADKDGNPIFDGHSYVLTEITNGISKVLSKKAELKDRISYDKAKRELILKGLSSKAGTIYRLEYTTRIVNNSIANKVALKYGTSLLNQTDEFSHNIRYWAKVEWKNKPVTELKIHKTGDDNTNLDGVKFKLNAVGHNLAADVVTEATTGVDGYAKFDKLPAGKYELNEITGKDGYDLPENPRYEFEIIKADTGFTISELKENTAFKIVPNDTELGYELNIINKKTKNKPKDEPPTPPSQPPVTPPPSTPIVPPSPDKPTTPSTPSKPDVPSTPPSPEVPKLPSKPAPPVTPSNTPGEPETPTGENETPEIPIDPPSTTPEREIPTYTIDSLPNPNDPDSPDEFIAVDENGIPLGRYVKKTKPDGTSEYVLVDEDGTPQGVIQKKLRLPKTGGSSNLFYYIFGGLSLITAVALLFRRKRQ